MLNKKAADPKRKPLSLSVPLSFSVSLSLGVGGGVSLGVFTQLWRPQVG